MQQFGFCLQNLKKSSSPNYLTEFLLSLTHKASWNDLSKDPRTISYLNIKEITNNKRCTRCESGFN